MCKIMGICLSVLRWIEGGPSITLLLYNCSGTFECCTQI
jgi:hypothetical protein